MTLPKGHRAIIIEIDNRAREMGRDIGLPSVERDNFDELQSMLEGPVGISLQLPMAEVERWKGQFNVPARLTE